MIIPSGVLYTAFFQMLQILTFFFEIVGATLIIYGGIRAAVQVVLLETKRVKTPYNQIRMHLTSRIVFGLEFLIAADILATILDPSQEELIMLAVVVVIRTVLGYFLEKEAVEFEIT